MPIAPNFGKIFVQRLNDQFQQTWKSNMHASSRFVYLTQKCIRTKCLFICYKNTRNPQHLYQASGRYVNVSDRGWRHKTFYIGLSYIASFEKWILYVGASVRTISGNGQQLRKNKLHTGSYMSIGGNQSLLCLCKTDIWRQAKIVSWLNTTDQDHLHWKLYLILCCFILLILLYWYMGMQMYVYMYPSPRISDWCDYRHIYVNIWNPGLLTRYI